jgi:hypothetical protein
MTWSIVTLPRSAEWALGRLLSADHLTWPNSSWQQAELNDLIATVIPVSGLADDAQPIVTPGGLSRDTGQVVRTNNRYVGRIYEMRRGNGLQVGDLLIPRYFLSPALVVAQAHTGLGFAGTFHAVRCSDPRIAAWLWAVLSSGVGQRIRSEMSTGANTPVLSRGRLLELHVPLPPEEDLRVRLVALDPLLEHSQVVDMRTDEVQGSWWRIADLRGAERWDIFITLAEPDLLRSGIPLAELCEDVALGKAVHGHVLPSARPGWQRVYTARSVRTGRIDDLWLDPAKRTTVAEPGDVLIPSVGAKGLSALAAQHAAVDRDVIRCRLHDSGISERLVHYLNSDRGQSLRRILTSGLIPRLTLQEARKFPVPEDIARDEANHPSAVEFRPLSEQLDDLLWS